MKPMSIENNETLIKAADDMLLIVQALLKLSNEQRQLAACLAALPFEELYDDHYLIPVYREFAGRLNTISQMADVADTDLALTSLVSDLYRMRYESHAALDFLG